MGSACAKRCSAIRTGWVSSAALVPKLANWACRSPFQRAMMEKMLGISRAKQLPEFAGETFEAWLERTGIPAAPAEPAAKVAIFHTCFVNYYNPAPGRALVAVLARNRCAIASPAQNCCGMPALDGGDVAFAQKLARANVASMLPLVRQGYRVAAINPTCSLMMRKEYPDLLDTAEARELAAAVADPHELLYALRREGKFDREFRTTPGKVAYHVPCHLKAQNVGLRSRDLIRSIPGAEVVTVDACTAHDGTWAMKKEFFELSMKWGAKAFAGMKDAEAQVLATRLSAGRDPDRAGHRHAPAQPGRNTGARLRGRRLRRASAAAGTTGRRGVKAVKPITPLEVLPVTTYDRVRPLLRPLCIAEKARRRLAVGPHLTLMFENRQTVWYQIQEILRTERIFEDAAINAEVETYNELSRARANSSPPCSSSMRSRPSATPNLLASSAWSAICGWSSTGGASARASTSDRCRPTR